MICPYCNAENRDGAMFCTHCGREMTGAAQDVPAQQPPAQQPPIQQPYPQQPYPQQPYGQQMPGAQPYAPGYDPGLRQAVSDAKNALIMAIVGIFCFGIILEPLAIVNARKAKKVLSPGDEGYGNAQAAEIIGWIAVSLWVVSLCITVIIAISGGYR